MTFNQRIVRLFTAFCALSFFSLSANAQEAVSFNEVGLNATPFINQYLDFGDDDDELISPYVLTYEHRFNKLGVRFGLGVVASTDNQHPDDDNIEPDIAITSTVLAVRSGIVRYRDLSPRFSFKYGVDAFFMYELDKSVTTTTGFFGDDQEVTLSTTAWETGASPFFFLQFHITPQFSLGTELLGRISYRESVDKEQSSQLPEFDDVRRTDGMRFRIDPPTSLFFILRF